MPIEEVGIGAAQLPQLHLSNGMRVAHVRLLPLFLLPRTIDGSTLGVDIPHLSIVPVNVIQSKVLTNLYLGLVEAVIDGSTLGADIPHLSIVPVNGIRSKVSTNQYLGFVGAVISVGGHRVPSSLPGSGTGLLQGVSKPIKKY